MNPQFFNVIAGKDGEACILLYGNIGSRKDDVRSGDIVRELMEAGSLYKRIDVRINSMGGEVYAGIAIFNALRQSKANIHIYIDGIAASMASVIASARRPVYMSRHARLMLHSVSGGAYGNKEEIVRMATELASIENTLSGIYAERSGRTNEEIKALFFDGKDHWLTAAEALKEKLIDGIYDADPVPEGSSVEAIYTICQNRLINNSDMLIDLLRKRPSFSALADEDAVIAHVEHLEAEAGKVPGLNAQVADLSARIATIEDAARAARTDEITVLLDAAVNSGRIKEPQRTVYASLLEKDFDNGKAALESLPAIRRVTNELNPPVGSDTSPWEARMEEIKANLK